MSIPSFELHTGLDVLGKVSIQSEYVDVSMYKKIKFCYYSDVPINLCVSFSYTSTPSQGEATGPIYSNDYLAVMCWKNFEIDVCMNYIKMTITKMNNVDVNQILHVTCRGYGGTSKRSEVPANGIALKKEESEPSGGSTPPKRSFVDRLKSSPKSNGIGASTLEMPGLCLPNQIFVGGKNKVNVIPPPDKDGQVLTYKDGAIKWV
jgi:hypothetical protein